MNRSQLQMVLGLAVVLAAAIIVLASSGEILTAGLAIAIAILGIGLIVTSRVQRAR